MPDGEFNQCPEVCDDMDLAEGRLAQKHGKQFDQISFGVGFDLCNISGLSQRASTAEA